MPAPSSESAPHVTVLRDEGGQILAAIWTRGRNRFLHLPDVATFACPRGGLRVTAEPQPHVPQAAVAEAFHRSIVPLLLYFAGYEVLHASAVRSAGGAVVGFCAGARTGKSSLAYGLSTRGFSLWADDALALDVSQRPRALLLSFDPRLRPQTARFFETSSFQPPSDPPAGGETAPVGALAVIKRMTGGTDAVQIDRLRGGRAFDEVIGHAYRVGLKTDHARRRTLIENYMKLIASVPVFEIRFRPGFRHFSSVLAAVTELLEAELGRAA